MLHVLINGDQYMEARLLRCRYQFTVRKSFKA
jgi:hypothetical protein